MIADPNQLLHWQRLLDVPSPDAADTADKIAHNLQAARGKHRPWLTTCLAGVTALRDGVSVPVEVPLPPLPVRRPAAEGADVANAVWLAYLLQATGSTPAADWLRSFIDTLAPVALVFSIDDNPEPWWQNEMVILHALHSFALTSRDDDLLQKTLACTDYHLREIQPDHATNEPWAVHSYASHVDGTMTAETLLHAGFIQHGGRLGRVSQQLCRDASASLSAYLAGGTP